MNNDTRDHSAGSLPRGVERLRWTGAVLASLLLMATACGGDDPEPATTVADDPTGTTEEAGDRSLYGIDLSGLDLPAADPYEDYETYEDDTGQVEIVAPAAWDDVDTSVGEYEGLDVPGIWASTDLEALQGGFSVPGVQVDLHTADSEADLLELLDIDNATDDVCAQVETFDYDDGLYTGAAELWTDCSENNAALLEVAALRDEDQYITLEIQMLTDADIDAAVVALEAMLATEVGPGSAPEDTEPSDTRPPVTEDEPTTTADPDLDEESLGQVVDLHDGDATVTSAEDFAVAVPSGPENEWRVRQDFTTFDVIYLHDEESADGQTVYHRFIAGPVAGPTGPFVTLTFENCPLCPPELGQPLEVVTLRIEKVL